MRWRLVAIIVIPTTVAVVLGGLRISASTTKADAFQRVERLAELGARITILTHNVAAERDATVGYIAANRPAASLDALKANYRQVDEAANDVREAYAQIQGANPAKDQATKAISRLDDLPNLRTVATRTKMPAFAMVSRYSEINADLLAFHDSISEGVADPQLAENVQALSAFARAKEQASRQRAILYIALIGRRFDSGELDALISARAQQASELNEFTGAASVQQRQAYGDTVTGPQVDQAEDLRQRAIIQGQQGRLLNIDPATGNNSEEWLGAITGTIDRMYLVEGQLVDQVLNRARTVRADAQRASLLDGVLVIAVLILVILVTLFVAQSMVRPLRRLRAGALEVAGHSLPGLVHRLRESEGTDAVIDVKPIDVSATDEIGEVARAFDEVHREAVRLAANEAMLRGNMNALFVNLSRRSQSLIERQLRLIDDLEQGERDEDRLANLFKLDHLATRMRRNSENLLVLGGQEQVRRWNRPVPLIDVVRASLSEVEQYSRIALRIQGEVSILGPVVNDLVHLVAELVENATVFSKASTKVTVSGHLLSGGGAMLQISDNGLGMTPEELQEANWRLANPPIVDAGVARRMGLFVVGRLAARHGVRVELRAALSGGLTAFVLLPPQAIAQSAGAPRRSGFDPSSTDAIEAMLATQGVGAPPAPAEPRPSPMPTPPPERMSGPVPGSAPAGRPQFVTEETRGYLAGARQPFADTGPFPMGMSPPEGRTPGGRERDRVVDRDPERSSPERGSDRGFDRGPGAYADRPEERRPTRADPGRPGARSERGEPPRGEEAGPGGRPGRDPYLGLQGNGTEAPKRGHGLPRRNKSRPARPPSEPAPPQAAPAPAGSGAPAEPTDREERLPIFDAIESEWFQRRAKTSPSARGGADDLPAWRSTGDEGWEAAEAVRRPTAGGQTASGLPKRVPGRNRVPGSATVGPTPTRPAAPAPVPGGSADAVRNRFASFQQGVHRGRAAARAEGKSETDDE